MKKRICISMIALMTVVSLTGCETNEDYKIVKTESKDIETIVDIEEDVSVIASYEDEIENRSDISEENESEDEGVYSIEYTPCDGKKYVLVQKMIDENNYLISLINSDNSNIVQEIEVNTFYTNPINCAAFKLDDINMDGYIDVPFVTGMGNVNICYDVYLWNPDKNELQKCNVPVSEQEFCGVYTLNPEERTMDVFVHLSAGESYWYRYQWSDFDKCILVKYMEYDYDCNLNNNVCDRRVYITFEEGKESQVVIDDTFITEEDDYERMDEYLHFFEMIPTNISNNGSTTLYEGYYYKDDKVVECSFVVDEENHSLKY